MILVLRRTAIFIAIVLAWALLAAAVAHSTGAFSGLIGERSAAVAGDD